MSFNLTFKQYLESKERLLEAIKQTPQQICHYTVNHYCKLPIGTSKNEKLFVSLKPKHTVIVEWLYENVDNPKIVNLSLKNSEKIIEKYDTFWQGSKLIKWLQRHTTEHDNTGNDNSTTP